MGDAAWFSMSQKILIVHGSMVFRKNLKPEQGQQNSKIQMTLWHGKHHGKMMEIKLLIQLMTRTSRRKTFLADRAAKVSGLNMIQEPVRSSDTESHD